MPIRAFLAGQDHDGDLKDVDDRSPWSVDIEPQPDARAQKILAEPI
jgi:hypothetical protein